MPVIPGSSPGQALSNAKDLDAISLLSIVRNDALLSVA